MLRFTETLNGTVLDVVLESLLRNKNKILTESDNDDNIKGKLTAPEIKTVMRWMLL